MSRSDAFANISPATKPTASALDFIREDGTTPRHRVDTEPAEFLRHR